MYFWWWKCSALLYRLWCLFKAETSENIEAVRAAATSCGVIGIKLLQFLVMHDGFLSAEGKERFRDMLEDCEAHDWDYTAGVYEATFGKRIEDDFDVDEPGARVPIGSGSIGQVYRLRQKCTGQYVAMKVRHPGVERMANVFVTNLSMVLRVWRVPFAVLIQQCLVNIQLQLDYLTEARNMRMVREAMLCEKHIVIPRVIAATKEVIIMTYHDGVMFPDIKDKKVRFRVANDIFLFMMASLVCHNFVHCDMHYGNWKVNPETEQIIVYDCGIVGRLGRKYEPQTVKDFVLGAFSGDLTKVARSICCDFERDPKAHVLRGDIAELMSRYYKHNTDRFADFVKKAVESGVKLDQEVLRCFQGMIICRSTFAVSRDYIVTILVDDEKSYSEILLCLNHGLSLRTGRWVNLQRHFKKWMHEDPEIERKFYDWMDASYGHRDRSVLVDVLQKHMALR